MIHERMESFLDSVATQQHGCRLGNTGGYIELWNRTGKRFTLSLETIRTTLQDILNNLDSFSAASVYVEKTWRDLGAKYFSSAAANSLITVQTKPFFFVLKNIIDFANDDSVSEIGASQIVTLTEDRLKNAIHVIDEVIQEFSPEHNEAVDHYPINLQTSNEFDFTLKNILFKGVPGTGKSRIINKIIRQKLMISEENTENILHINVHSASSNADLMQGIGITTENNQIAYKEKQGLVYNHIRKACYAPKQPFVLILEEIQENSLNELIGDLIYLVEPSKRLQISKLSDTLTSGDFLPYLGNGSIIEKYIEESHKKYTELKSIGDPEYKNFEVHSINIPYLVSTSTEYRTMILPDNFYIFCTSNYRDDKKVIEDNLLRRFDVIELYPQYHEGYKDKDNIPPFLNTLNTSIREVFQSEIHPDRFQVGHANWINIVENDNVSFYKALLKVVIDFKEIREIESSLLYDIFLQTEKELQSQSWVKTLFTAALDAFKRESPSYAELVSFIQNRAYSEIMDLSRLPSEQE